jgi:sulfur carrier protein ThiS
MPAFFRAKDGSVAALALRAGPHIKELLQANGIPANSVIVSKNGKIVSEFNADFADTDRIEVNHIRPYDLNVTRNPALRLFPVDEPIYTKAVTFEKDGDLEIVAEQFNWSTYPNFIEDTFVDAIQSRRLLNKDDRLAVGLSGGRDSVAFLTLMARTRHRLPPFSMLPVTVIGLPDWEEPSTFAAARNAAAALGAEHVLVSAEEVQEIFKLKCSLLEALDGVLAQTSGSPIMMITHHVMRRAIEVAAERRGMNRIILGLNADDLLATLVSWFLNGHPMGPIPLRPIGPFDYLFPLFRITKKELTLYLECVRPDLNRQGAPGRFTRGPGERSMSYALADHLLSLMPGIDYYATDAFARIGGYVQMPDHATCATCGAAFLAIDSSVSGTKIQCDVCDILEVYR